MMEFITAPLIVGITVFGTYKLFELFVRRRERMAIIEKISDNLDLTKVQYSLNSIFGSLSDKTSFMGLKIGCLLVGIGFGLLVGLTINTSVMIAGNPNIENHMIHELYGTAYGASVFLFGGLGLLVSFIIEQKLKKRKKEDA